MNWQDLKQEWSYSLQEMYSANEASNIIQILAEESLPQYSKIQFRDTQFELKSEDLTLLRPLIQRLQRSEPLQYVLGKAWFYDIELKVNSNVLIPRPETEELVSWILECAPKSPCMLLDIGTGSGCIPLSIAKHLPSSMVSALDVDPNVIQLAQTNSQDLNLEVNFKVIDILDASLWDSLGNYDIIVSNPPYIPFKEKLEMKENVLAHEPHLALFVEDTDPLLFYNTIADFAKIALPENGLLFFECNEFNATEVCEMLRLKGFQSIELKKDLQGKDRMIKSSLSHKK